MYYPRRNRYNKTLEEYGFRQVGKIVNIKQIKEKYTCLDYLGESRIVKKLSGGYLCRAPWREDRHPSLSVTLDGKGWQDHSDGTHGNLIELVARCIGTNDFGRICAEFDNLSSFDTVKSPDGSKEKKADGFARFDTVPLSQWQLKQYLKQRGIDPEFAHRFGIKEAHYTFRSDKPGYLFSLAYQNNRGGYELRSASFKGSKSPKGITTHIIRNDAPYVVFEGFMDMLSFATLNGGQKHNYLVLNSVVNVDVAIETLMWTKSQIYLCLDNDKAGTETTQKMLAALSGARDIRQRILPNKDINDYLLHREI